MSVVPAAELKTVETISILIYSIYFFCIFKAKKVVAKTNTSEQKSVSARAPNAYILFGKDQRAKFREQNPAVTPQITMKQIADKWKALSDQEREVSICVQWLGLVVVFLILPV